MTINNELEAFKILLPYLNVIFDNEVAMGIADSEKYLSVFLNNKIPLKIAEGDSITRGGAAYEALKSGKVVIRKVPKEVYGVTIKSYAIPIKGDNGEIKGVIAVAKGVEKSEQINDLSQNLARQMSEISSVVSGLSEGVQQLVELNQGVNNEVVHAIETTKNTDQVLNFVQSISKQTNLLGLNAAIESARAGEAGKGFSVVAQEIRKLSNSSAESIKKIDNVLKGIVNSIEKISVNINSTSELFEGQVAAFEQINASIEEISSNAQVLKNLSEKL